MKTFKKKKKKTDKKSFDLLLVTFDFVGITLMVHTYMYLNAWKLVHNPLLDKKHYVEQ